MHKHPRGRRLDRIGVGGHSKQRGRPSPKPTGHSQPPYDVLLCSCSAASLDVRPRQVEHAVTRRWTAREEDPEEPRLCWEGRGPFSTAISIIFPAIQQKQVVEVELRKGQLGFIVPAMGRGGAA